MGRYLVTFTDRSTEIFEGVDSFDARNRAIRATGKCWHQADLLPRGAE
jgi:hypothetical protein